MILRVFLALLACLLTLAAPVSAHTPISHCTFVPPPVALFSEQPSNEQDCGPLTLHLDGLHDRAGPCGGVLVRQNPWSSFDPEGLEMERCMMCHGLPWQERSQIGLPQDQPWYNAAGTEVFTKPIATFMGVAAAVPAAIVAEPYVTAAALRSLQAYATSAVVRVSTNAAIVGALVYEETDDLEAAATSAALVGFQAYVEGEFGARPVKAPYSNLKIHLVLLQGKISLKLS